MCSSFLWICIRKNGVKLEAATEPVTYGDLEPIDVMAGAQVDADTKDGLYLYTAAERLEAGDWLHQKLQDMI